MILKELTKGLIELILPNNCLLCEKKINSGKFICEQCQNFERNLPPFCRKCGISISVDSKTRLCSRCRGKNFYFTRNLSLFIYKEPLASLIHLFKYQGFDFLADIFSQRLIEFIEELPIPVKNYNLLTSVPLHRRKLREREFNHSRLIAKKLSKYFLIPYKDTLRAKRYLKSQVNKSVESRTLDIRDNFYIIEEVKEKNIILIDDVFTTGATLSECAKALKNKGAKEILTITLAIRKLN
ncbi:MAG: hypothetical protein DRP61_04525 [Candidatus Omnitrophota bacterium]|nr:MAG: hypothetical protein DRP61_04525 [Candidatus Omnitrophota bacterium]